MGQITEKRGFFDLKKQFIFYASYHNLPVNVAMIMSMIYVVSYVLMDPVAGTLGALLMIYLNQWTYKMVLSGAPLMGYPLWQPILAFHAFMWMVQFIGHGMFEKRAPALLDSWDQALITAPLFVLLEVLFFFGYRKSFYKECMIEVEREIKRFKTGGKSK